MKIRGERWGVREYIATATAGVAAVGTLATVAYFSRSGSAASRTSSRPVAARTVGPDSGCLELTAQIVEEPTASGTTYEIGLVGLWGAGVDVVGEQFTLDRVSPDPSGPGAHYMTPVIRMQQGVLPSLFHQFPPTTFFETVDIRGAIITATGRQLAGPLCQHEITIAPIPETTVPEPPAIIPPSYAQELIGVG